MPNIEIYGIMDSREQANILTKVFSTIKEHFPDNFEDTVATIIDSEVYDFNMISKPYIRLSHEDSKLATNIGKTLSLATSLDVKVNLVASFTSK